MEWFFPSPESLFTLLNKTRTAVKTKIQNQEEREEVLRRLAHAEEYLQEVKKQGPGKLLKDAVSTTGKVLQEAMDAIEKQNSQGYLKQVWRATDNAKLLEQLKDRVSYWEGSTHRALTLSASHAEPPQGNQKAVLAKKYSYIPDNYRTLLEVEAALREQGLESTNLILGIDFTKSNEWTGKWSFGGQCLHKIGGAPNPYEQAISIIGKVLASFDEDNLIPCFGFGDDTIHDSNVFSFHHDNSPCHGCEEVLYCYRKIVPHLRLAGPTSFAPIVEAAVDIVDRSGGQHHVLIIVADGQVTRSVDTSDGELSPQEKAMVDSIVMASNYPLSIVLVGVGDGPWGDMHKFDDYLPARDFDNFQFVNFTSIMSRDTSPETKESEFALAALMEIPIQYKATMELGILGRSTGKAKRVVPAPPPLPAAAQSSRRCVAEPICAAGSVGRTTPHARSVGSRFARG